MAHGLFVFSCVAAKKDLLELALDIYVELPSSSLNDVYFMYVFVPAETDRQLLLCFTPLFTLKVTEIAVE